jgi:hypothetical protein
MVPAGLILRCFSPPWLASDRFPNDRVVDPANTNNIISDDLTLAERGEIKAAAEQAIKTTNWNQIVR